MPTHHNKTLVESVKSGNTVCRTIQILPFI